MTGAPPGETPGGAPPARIGRFQVRGELGRGGMGVVYRALDPDLQREVALKVLLSGDHAGAQQVERFLREGRAASRLDHPNLVRVHDAGWADGRLYLVMDLVDGPSLAERLAAGPLTPEEAADVAATLGDGLSWAHARGLVHRDVKPANVLFRADGTPMLADFGLATEVGADARLTVSGQILGTPAYVAPEQTRRREPLPASDQYSLGALLYHCLVGHPPYTGESAPEVLYAVIEGPPPPLPPSVPPGLRWITERAMTRDPGKRYPSCAAFSADLRAWRAGGPLTAGPPSLAARGRSWVSRRRLPLAFGFGAVAVALAAAWFVDTLRRDQSDRARAATEAEARATFAAIDDADRDAALATFAADPRWRNTTAAVDALLELAERETDPDRAAARFAESYAASTNPASQDAALRGLARQFRRAWRFTALSAVLDRLADRTPDAGADPEIAQLRADADLAGRRFGAAAASLAAAGHPGSTLAQKFVAARSLGQTNGVGQVVDAQDDGVREWWHVEGNRRLMRRTLRPDGDDRVVVELPTDAWTFRVVPGTPDLVVWSSAVDADVVSLLALDGSTEPFRWPDSVMRDAVRLGDDLVVAIGPYERHLVRLHPEGDTWRTSPASPTIDALHSDVNALALGDFDGDGAAELGVAVGAWTAYDLRVLDPADLAGPALARQKLGFVSSLVVEPARPRDRLWALDSDEYGTQVVFPAGRPFGEPAGATAWTLGPNGLEREVTLTAPTVPGHPSEANALLVADLDGNGTNEVVYGVVRFDGHPATVIHVDGRPDAPPLLVLDTWPLFAADLGPERGDELAVAVGPDVLRAREAWVLGVGTDTLPPRDAAPTASAPPDGLDARTTAAWRRAEELVSMGLVRAAAESLDTLADDAGGPAARARAAELWADVPDPDRAVVARLDAARTSGRSDWYVAAAEALRGEHRFAEAAEAWKAAGVPVPAAVRAEADDWRQSVIDFSASWPSSAARTLPEALAPDRARQGYTATVLSLGGAVFEVPVHAAPGRVHLELDATLLRAEWGSGFELALPIGDSAARVGVRTWGGGGRLERELFCSAPGEEAESFRMPVASVESVSELHLVLDASTTAGTWRCALTQDGETHTALHPLLRALPGGDGAVLLRSTDHASSPGLMSRVLVHRVTVGGSRLTLRPTSASTADPWAELAAHIDAGDTQAFADGLRRIPEGPDYQSGVVRLLRTRLATAGPALHRLRSDAYYQWFDAAWSNAFHAHPDDPELDAAFTTGLAGLEDEWTTLPAAQRRTGALLLARRARAWVVAGQLGAAARDLALASEALGDVRDPGGEAGFELAVAWIAFGALAADRDDPRAAAATEQARRYTPPEIVDDLLAAQLRRP